MAKQPTDRKPGRPHHITVEVNPEKPGEEAVGHPAVGVGRPEEVARGPGRPPIARSNGLALKLYEIMTREVEVLSPDASLEDAARRMRDLDVGLMPVCAGEQLMGMLTDRDIIVRAVAEGCHPRVTLVRDVMTPEVRFCYEDQDVEDAARLMNVEQIRRLPILDREHRLAGIVALGDLAVRAGDERLSARVLEGVSEPTR